MKSTNFLLPALGLCILINACQKDQSTSSEMTPLSVRMTDAPGNFEEVNVDIKEVQVNSHKSGWITLTTKAGIYNLLTLANGLDTLLGSAVVPSGKIEEIRLILGTNNTVKVNGVVYPLATPSAQQSGLKIKIDDEDLAGSAGHIILFDFDAGKSIHLTGNGTYMLKPVLRHIHKNQIVTGIKGSVIPPQSHPNILAILGSDTISTYTNNDGDFFIKGLVAGSYTLVLLPNGLYKDTTFKNVIVTTGSVTKMGSITLHL